MARERILPEQNTMINVMEEPLFEIFCSDRDLGPISVELLGIIYKNTVIFLR